MKFNLVYEEGLEIRQYRNLIVWLEHKEIGHRFEWTNTGSYVADIVVIDDEQDAIYFSLTFKHISVCKHD